MPWDTPTGKFDAIYTYGHPAVGPALLDQLPGIKVISNFGVGVDHIDVPAATARGIPVGNTPGILDGATADLAFALLLAAGRRVVEGDRYARGPNFLHYDPSYMQKDFFIAPSLPFLRRELEALVRRFGIPVL